MISQLVLALVSVAACSSLCSRLAAASSEGKSDVIVRVSNILREPVDAEVEFTEVAVTGFRQVLTRAVAKGVLHVELPASVYLLKLKAAGYKNRYQILNVALPTTIVRIGLNLARMGDPERNSIRGRVVPDGGSLSHVTVRLVPVLNNDVIHDVELSADGTFEHGGLEAGDYVVCVYRRDKLQIARQESCFGEITTADLRIPQP